MLSGLTTAEAAAMASGKPVPEHRILLVVEPAKLAYLRETLETLSRYVSQVTLWVFDPSRPDSLRSMNAADLLNELAERTREKLPKVDVQPHAVSTRTLRLHTDDDGSGGAAPASGMLTTASGATAWAGPWSAAPAAPGPQNSPPRAAAPVERPSQPTLRFTHEAEGRGSEKPRPSAQPPAQASPQAHVPVPGSGGGSEKLGPGQARERGQSEDATSEPLLTDEELQMLLGDDPPGASARKG